MLFTDAQISIWIGGFVWPWIRFSAMLLAAPLFSNMQIPIQVRILLGVALAVAVMPAVGPVPAVDLLSVEALLVALQEVLAGVLIGLMLSMSFQAAAVAGEAVGLTMGLGFATMVDPQSGMTQPVISQFLIILATLLFLSLGGHLMLIDLLAQSFRSLPVGNGGLVRQDFLAVVAFGSQMFAGGVLLALPAVAVLLVVQLAMGVMTRAAPQMNIFSVGFPVTMLVGFLAMLLLILPVLQPRLVELWGDAFGVARGLLGG